MRIVHGLFYTVIAMLGILGMAFLIIIFGDSRYEQGTEKKEVRRDYEEAR